MVLRSLREAHIPIAVVMGGGYAQNIADIADIHFNTVKLASELARDLRLTI